MRILVTGGAGYIGSHTAVALIEAGHEVLIVDDLSTSSVESVWRVESITGATIPVLKSDLRDNEALTKFIRQHLPVDAVIHFAGLKAVAESVQDPLRYYDVNVGASLSLLRVMAEADINTIVFSSSATVYGDPESLPVDEESPTRLALANPYGKTKRIIEEILRDATDANPKLSATSLRYFNPVGAHISGMIGEDPHGIPNNLMPIVARVALGALPQVSVFGGDFDTPDGTALRDYIHITDLARGHVAALEHAHPGFEVYNLGTGVPTSVLELIAAFSRASGREIPYAITGRREGDVAASYADPTKAEQKLGWRAELSLEQACADFWNWQVRNPDGYPR